MIGKRSKGGKLGGVTLSASIGFSKSQSQSQSRDETVISSIIRSGDIQLRTGGAGEDSTITLLGSSAFARNTVEMLAEGGITLASAQDTDTYSGSSRSKSMSLSIGATVTAADSSPSLTASFNKSNSQYSGRDVTQIESVVSAGNTATLGTPGALDMDGAIVSAGRVEIAAGSLDINSLQDSSTYNSRNTSTGLSVTVKTGGAVSAALNLGKGKQSGDFASVREQAGIFAGAGGLDVTVTGATTLDGAVIASEGGGTLDTATLATSDLENFERYSASQMNIGVGLGNIGKNSSGKAASGANKQPGSSLPTIATPLGTLSATPPVVLAASGSQSGTTRAAISGNITATIAGVTGTPAGLSRDTDSANAGAILKEFDAAKRAEIAKGFEATSILVSEVGTYQANRAREADDAARKEAEVKCRCAVDAATLEPVLDNSGQRVVLSQAQIDQRAQDAIRLRKSSAGYEAGGRKRQILTGLTAAASGNVTGNAVGLLQDYAVNVLQQMVAEKVGERKNTLSDDARAILHGIIGCAAGSASSGGSCGAGAGGQAGAAVLTALLKPDYQKGALDKDGKHTGSAAEKTAYSQIIQTLVTAVAAAAGAEGSALGKALAGAQAEVDNNTILGERRPEPLSRGYNFFELAKMNSRLRAAIEAAREEDETDQELNDRYNKYLACGASATRDCDFDVTLEALATQFDIAADSVDEQRDSLKNELIDRGTTLGLSSDERKRIETADLSELLTIQKEVAFKEKMATLKGLNDSFSKGFSERFEAAPQAVKDEVFRDFSEGRGTGFLTQSLGSVANALISEEQLLTLYFAEKSARVSGSQALEDAKNSISHGADEQRAAIAKEAAGLRAQGKNSEADWLERRANADIAAEEAMKKNLLDSGQFILELARDPEQGLKDGGKGAGLAVAGALDAIFLDDRTPTEIYEDVSNRFGVEIKNFANLPPAEQGRQLGQLRGEIAAEAVKIIASGGAGRAATAGSAGAATNAANKLIAAETRKISGTPSPNAPDTPKTGPDSKTPGKEIDSGPSKSVKVVAGNNADVPDVPVGVPYFRVQGPGAGKATSRDALTVNSDGSVNITPGCTGTICVSVEGPDHAAYYITNKRPDGSVVVFDVDRATHNRIMDNLVPQQGNSGAGVKLTDTSTPGTSIELDRAFSELMTSDSSNGRVLTQREFLDEFGGD